MLNWFKSRFIKREYLALTVKGSGTCTMTPADACDLIQDADDPKMYEVKSVWMTPREYAAMPEFLGW